MVLSALFGPFQVLPVYRRTPCRNHRTSICLHPKFAYNDLFGVCCTFCLRPYTVALLSLCSLFSLLLATDCSIPQC